MLYRLVRPLLFQLDAERAHDFALAAAARLSTHPRFARLVRHVTSPQDDPVTFAGLTFPNRVGLAAGLDKNGVAPLAWWAFGFGFAELGTVTPRPQPGNPRPRMFRDVRRRALLNRMGFNNAGAAALVAKLRDASARGCRPPFPLGVSVGKNADTPLDRAADDYAAAAAAVAPVADFVSVNVSSPNTAGLRSLQTAGTLQPLVRAVRAAVGHRPLLVKVAPELTGPPLEAVLDACLAEGAVGVIATNTLARFDKAGKPIGGESGRPLGELARRRVAEVRRHVGDRVMVVGVGGVDGVRSARALLAAGADLVQVYSGLVFDGPFLAVRLARALRGRQRRVDPGPVRFGTVG